MAKIDLERLIADILQMNGADRIKTDGSKELETADLMNALHSQGLDYKQGEIVDMEPVSAYEFTNDADDIYYWLSALRFKLLGKCSSADGEAHNLVCTVRFSPTGSGDVLVVEIPRMLSETLPLRIDDEKSIVAEFIRQRNLFVIKPTI